MNVQQPNKHLCEEEEESSNDLMSMGDSQSERANSPICTVPKIFPEHGRQVEELLTDLRKGHCPEDPERGLENAGDRALNTLNVTDFP